MSLEPTSVPLVGVWHCERLASARELALGLAAKGLAYEIAAVGKGWVILVEPPAAELALEELRATAESERPLEEAASLEPIRLSSLLVPAVVMSAFFQAQVWFGPRWTDAGIANSQAMLHQGEWWRAITALTLHGDLGHFLANLVTGLLFAAFLQPELGSGVAWLLVLLSGTLGNALNAWGYRGEPHFSLGASTAVFGMLGLLVANDLAARWRSLETRHKWSLIVPLGAGLSLLAYLGVGDGVERVDFMAHGWGFLCGLLIGLLVAAGGEGRRAPSPVQWGAALTVALLLAGAWGRAVSAQAVGELLRR